MTYVVEPSTFGVGYSIFRIKTKDGVDQKIYLIDVPSEAEARKLCPGAIVNTVPGESEYLTKQRQQV